MNKMQLLDKLAEFASAEITKSNLSDKQYNEIVSLANRIESLPNSDITKVPQIRMLISLYQNLDKKAITEPRDAQKLQENNALSAYNSSMARSLAIWKMSLNSTPSDDEITAKTALLDKAYRDNLKNKAENASKRNEYIQSL